MPPPAVPKTSAGRAARPAALTFTNMGEVLEIARGLYAGGITPVNVDRPEKLVPILIAGAELGLGIMQSVESIYVLNGKTCLYGDVGKALVLQSGQLEYQKEEVAGSGDDRTATVTVKRAGQPEASFSFKLATAKRFPSYKKAQEKGGPWATDPDQMLKWRARWRAWRSEFADVLRGLTGVEEAEDEPVLAEVTSVRPAAPPPPPPAALPAATTPAPAPPPGDAAEPMASAAGPDGARTTPAQLAELKRIRGLLMQQKRITDPAAQAAEWATWLKPLGVTTAKDLTPTAADELTHRLGHDVDPQKYPSPF